MLILLNPERLTQYTLDESEGTDEEVEAILTKAQHEMEALFNRAYSPGSPVDQRLDAWTQISQAFEAFISILSQSHLKEGIEKNTSHARRLTEWFKTMLIWTLTTKSKGLFDSNVPQNFQDAQKAPEVPRQLRQEMLNQRREKDKEWVQRVGSRLPRYPYRW